MLSFHRGLFLFLLTGYNLFGSAFSKSVKGNDVLVVLDSHDQESQYSIFFSSMKKRGLQLIIKAIGDKDIDVMEYEEIKYPHVIFLSPVGNALKGKTSVKNMLEYFNKGGNIFLAVNGTLNENYRELAYEFGMELDFRGTAAVDHFYHQSDDPNTLVCSHFTPLEHIVPKEAQQGPPVLYKGVAFRRTSEDNPLYFNILNGRSTTYSSDVEDGVLESVPFTYGQTLGLVGALQGRNNARFVLSGSTDMFKDEFLKAKVSMKNLDGSIKKFEKTGNEDFVGEISKWAFHEKSVLKVERVYHHKVGKREKQDAYRINDDIEYHIDISEFNNGEWKPLKANDVQLEVIMLDPYIRVTMKGKEMVDRTTYVTQVKLPDVYGVFTFKVNYRRPGYSYIEAKEVLPIRPFRHNEYDRFLVVAYPYYAGSFSMIGGFLIFSFVWLYHKDSTKPKQA